ncbi:hypothetical protein ACHIPZ_00510 [Antrihabitans sp. NCIMB 15449]|uniref:Uncharacterized protein n=1 Tax=Antrihabitans spumae TaxID=3373370 RepID=A0ABW7JFG9_9NOCA
MSPNLRELINALGALATGALAGFVLADARGGTWGFVASPGQIERWQASVADSVAIGIALAIPACALMAYKGSRRLAWISIVALASIVTGLTISRAGGATIDFAIAVQYVRAGAAGLILGCATAAVWGRISGQLAVAIGTLSAYLLARAWIKSGDLGAAAAQFGDPPRTLMFVAIVLAVAAAVTAQSAYRLQRLDARTIRWAVAAAIAFVVVNRLLFSWITDQPLDSRFGTWVVIGISIAVVLVLVDLIARAVSRPNGQFLLVATAVAAGATLVLNDVRQAYLTVDTWWIVIVGIVAVAVGLRISVLWKHPIAGLGVMAVVPLVAAIWPDFGTDGPLLVIRVAIVGLGAAHALGSTFAADSAFATFGLAIPYAATVFTVAAAGPPRYVIEGTTSYKGSYEPLIGVPASQEVTQELSAGISLRLQARGDSTSMDGEMIFGRGVSLPKHPADLDDHLGPIAMLLAMAFCVVGVVTLPKKNAA